MVREIIISNGLVALIDDEDFDRVSSFHWVALRKLYTWYAQTGVRPRIRLHQFILGKIPGLEIDHIDGNGLNCQHSNLRHCTHSQNMQNRRLRSRDAPYKGVEFHKDGGYERWHASIRANGKAIHLGYFLSAEEAARAYNEAAVKYFGQYAGLNEIKPSDSPYWG